MSDAPADSPAEFEASLEALEALVARMESGELGLEQSLEEFQRGMQLVSRCQKALDEAQKRIEALAADEAAASVNADPAPTPNVPGRGSTDEIPF
ncbi:exodeoxyribonuclease VII small subunit [Thioalkalivibrio sp. ALJT]|uniref:exodeoxyribonuclease VII small subunit n=1 Tax=Thioalkalivibrio sp. ALJT TaxID=1158146 RepID=UPI000365D3F8|nr:exodeoxyribonuclease VII small subunit [Thioalkalivibrio sp. ALJT]